jgi:hypothetical protein
MAIRQWSDREWKLFEDKIGRVRIDDAEVISQLLDLTRGQDEHPEWYDSPCLCDLCLSCGD